MADSTGNELQESRSDARIQVRPGRPAYPVALEKRGIQAHHWAVLVETVWPAAESTRAVVAALDYCHARGLDPFKRPVHIVPMWNKKLGRSVETVWPGISELRTTASRTGKYAGKDETVFGEDTITKFTLGNMELQHPAWAQVTVYRLVDGVRCAFVGPKVFWLETYAKATAKTDKPNRMWEQRPYGQLDKCAEAAALRAAFPEELGSTYAAEEMEGREILDVTPEPEPPAPPPNEEARAAVDRFREEEEEEPPPAEPPGKEPPSDEPPPAEEPPARKPTTRPEKMISADEWEGLVQMAERKLGDGQGAGELWLRSYVTKTYKLKLERLPSKKVNEVAAAISAEERLRAQKEGEEPDTAGENLFGD